MTINFTMSDTIRRRQERGYTVYTTRTLYADGEAIGELTNFRSSRGKFMVNIMGMKVQHVKGSVKRLNEDLNRAYERGEFHILPQGYNAAARARLIACRDSLLKQVDTINAQLEELS